MTAPIGGGPDMDVYAEPIAEHASRHPQHPIDTQHMHFDPVAETYRPYTEEEIEQARQDRLDRRITIASMGFFALVMVTGAVAYWLGWLAGTGRLS